MALDKWGQGPIKLDEFCVVKGCHTRGRRPGECDRKKARLVVPMSGVAAYLVDL
jgi:hypothetical protein